MIMHRHWMVDHGHPWLWLLASLTVILLWGGAIWAIVSLFRRGGSAASGDGSARAAEGDPLASAERILADRFARGEIDADEYRARLAALRSAPSAPPSP